MFKLNLDHEGIALSWNNGFSEISYSDLRFEVQQAKLKLQSCFSTQNILTLTMSANPYSIIYLLAALESGLPVALFSSAWTAAEIEHRKKILGVTISIDEKYFGEKSQSQSCEKHPDAKLILFTSGTTTVPKAVQLSSLNIRSGLEAVISTLFFRKLRLQNLTLSLGHAFGLLGQLLPALECGAQTNFFNDIFELRSLLKKGELTGMISGVPQQLSLLLSLSSEVNPYVTDVVSAGDYLPIDLRKKLLATFPQARISSNYGQTEASPRILSINNSESGFLSQAAGRPVPGIEIRLSDNHELQISGPQVMLGYLGERPADCHKIHLGWLSTGDLAEIGDDLLVSIHGRIDDQMNISGERINPLELEHLFSNTFGVQALVFQDYNENGNAYLNLALIDSPNLPSLHQIRQQISNLVSSQKIPKNIYLADNFPTTENGKLIRKNIKNYISKWKKYDVN